MTSAESFTFRFNACPPVEGRVRDYMDMLGDLFSAASFEMLPDGSDEVTAFGIYASGRLCGLFTFKDDGSQMRIYKDPNTGLRVAEVVEGGVEG